MRWRFVIVTVLAFFAASLAAPFGSVAAPPLPQPWSPPRTVYIPETGHSIDGVFLDFWRANNGIANYGYPITPEVEHNGHIVQYYQYARFEYWPEDPYGNVVQLGKIGEELRPKLVYRASTRNESSAVVREMAAFAQAWVPLGDEAAERPNTATWRFVPETGHSVRHGFKSFWERSGEAAYLGNPLTEEYTLNAITYQVFERGQLAWKQGQEPWMEPLGQRLAEKYGISTAPVPQGDLPIYSEDLFVRPGPRSGTGGTPWIEISLGYQYLWAWEGDTIIFETYVSTGRPEFATPDGTYYINSKLESQTMAGVIGGEEYNVPDVPWVMYFTDRGHAIHGAYWHNNFGYPMSHGCVNLPLDVAAWMYSWAPIGTKIVIHQ